MSAGNTPRLRAPLSRGDLKPCFLNPLSSRNDAVGTSDRWPKSLFLRNTPTALQSDFCPPFSAWAWSVALPVRAGTCRERLAERCPAAHAAGYAGRRSSDSRKFRVYGSSDCIVPAQEGILSESGERNRLSSAERSDTHTGSRNAPPAHCETVLQWVARSAGVCCQQFYWPPSPSCIPLARSSCLPIPTRPSSPSVSAAWWLRA